MSGNAGSIIVGFDLGSGATMRAPAGAWASGLFVAANGAVSVVATNGAGYSITGVKLEIGNVATPFNRQSLAKSLADCQRYYQQVSPTLRLNSVAGANNNTTVAWPQMRASPTTALITAGTRGNVSGVALGAASSNSGYFGFGAVAAGDTYAITDLWSLSAEL